MPGGYVVFVDAPSPDAGDGRCRLYWQGPGGQWLPGPEARGSASCWPDQHAARAAVLAEGDQTEVDMARVGYDWVPPGVTQPTLWPDADAVVVRQPYWWVASYDVIGADGRVTGTGLVDVRSAVPSSPEEQDRLAQEVTTLLQIREVIGLHERARVRAWVLMAAQS